MNSGLVREVWRRANARCEYCRMPASVYPLPFHVDHIIALQHSGPSSLENLALACLQCNRHKGPNIAGLDPATGEIVRLYHPRLDRWQDHFELSGSILMGRTPVGRVTIAILAMNDADFLAVRQALIYERVFPTD